MFKIVSDKVGVPGDEFIPADGVNVHALLAGGFIVEIGKHKTPKPKSDNITSNKES
jgi:hypothetical protein